MIRTSDARVSHIMAIKREQDRNRQTYREIMQNGRAARVETLAKKLPDGSWAGQRCFIVGGGPSLRGFDFSRLKGERVIAINKSFYDVPFADVVFGMDRPFLDWVMEGKFGANFKVAFEAFKGIKLWLDLSNYSYPPGVYSIPSAGEIGWTKSLKEGLYHGQNSGYGAINLAIVLGANPIYLLGFDCSISALGEKHYHDGYPSGSNPDALNRFKRCFEAGAALLNGRPRIVNLNPNSALRCFEFGNKDTLWQ